MKFKRTDITIFEVDESEAPDYIDNPEEWARNEVVINGSAAEKRDDHMVIEKVSD